MRRYHKTSTTLAVLGIAFGLTLAGEATAGAPAAPSSSPFLVAQLGGGLLSNPPPTQGAPVFGAQPQSPSAQPQQPQQPAMSKEEAEKIAAREHAAMLTESRYPNATSCGTCHPREFAQWSVSQHSYAELSPPFMALQNFININVNGTNGDFCIRCHNQIGMAQEEATGISNLERPQSSREGITCVVCHRMAQKYNKASGRVALFTGDLTAPVNGPTGDKELKRVLAHPETYRVTANPKEVGRKIHGDVFKDTFLESSTFCGICHDVTLFNGFRLEEAFSEYRDSPAAAQGITCQDCHMGKIQGKPSGYDYGPAAVVGGVPTMPRKLTDHTFAGPDYPIVHPGIFPHNAKAQELATLAEWLKFDYKAGWGTDKFENNIPKGYTFPKPWDSVDARYDARAILEEQFKRLAAVRQKRLQVLRNGYGIGDVVTEEADNDGISFKVQVKNLTSGHNTPTGFTGEREVWLRVTVMDADGKVVFRSGDTDPNGDVRDDESAYVHTGKMPLDDQLFTLQSRFLVRNIRGSERERTVTIPYSTTALPFLRPPIRPLIILGRSVVERNHRKGIEPLGYRWARYSIDGDKLTGHGPYRATLELLGQMIPINLITTIQVVGFDYGVSPRAAADAVVAGREVIVKRDVTFDVK